MPRILKDGEYGKENPKIAKMVRRMTLFSDTLMTRIFLNPECTLLLLRVILDRNDLKIKKTSTQYGIKNLYGRSVILDILAVDKKGTLYNIEIQNLSSGAIPERARYLSSLIDANVSEVGKNFNKLPETYVIFITRKDFFGYGKPLYEIERTIKGIDKPFNDRAHIIYVNGENKTDTELGRLMQDFVCQKPENFHNAILADEVRHYKYTEEGLHTMCEIERKLINEERKIAKKEQAIEFALNLIADGTLPLEKIAKYSGLTLKEVKELAAKQTA